MNLMNPTRFTGKVYFGKFDRVTIGGVPFRVSASHAEGYLLCPEHESVLTQLFTHADLKAHAFAGIIRVENDFFSPASKKQSALETEFDFNLLTPKHRKMFGVRWAYCQAIEELRREGKLSLTFKALDRDADVIKAMADRFFQEFMSTQMAGRKAYGGGTTRFPERVSAKTLWNWFKNYTERGFAGLVDNRWKSGRSGSRLCVESEALLMQGAALYLNPDKPTMVSVVHTTRRLFVAKNEARAAKGLPQLTIPSRNTILARIKAFTPFEVILHRETKEKALAKFFPVGSGLKTGRPLERVEMDGWTVDLMTLAKATGLLQSFAPELAKEMELDGGKKRWHLFAAICCTTKCLLGLSITRHENAAAAVDCLKMIVNDKGQIADAVGSLSPWDMYGTPDLLVTDNGSAFKNHRFIGATHAISLNAMRAVAGLPQLRGTIERMFGTMSVGLVSRLSGRTFSDVVEKGEYPSEGRAVHTVQDFADMLVRWVVDVYHNTPHEGLGGETPLECWRRLSEIYGVRPGPDRQSQRFAFGVTASRKLSNVGLEVLGVRYNNELLMQQLRQDRKRDYELRWFHEDIGEIEVRVGDEWHTVRSVLPEFKGRPARDWLAARNVIRRGQPELREASNRKIAEALSEIDRMNAVAGERAGILSERWDDGMIKRFEENSLIGFKVGHETTSAGKSSGYGFAVDTSKLVEAAKPDRAPTPDAAPTSTKKNDWKF